MTRKEELQARLRKAIAPQDYLCYVCHRWIKKRESYDEDGSVNVHKKCVAKYQGGIYYGQAAQE